MARLFSIFCFRHISSSQRVWLCEKWIKSPVVWWSRQIIGRRSNFPILKTFLKHSFIAFEPGTVFISISNRQENSGIKKLQFVASDHVRKPESFPVRVYWSFADQSKELLYSRILEFDWSAVDQLEAKWNGPS